MSLPIATTPDASGRVYRRNGSALSLLEALVVRDYAGQAEVVLVGELLHHLELTVAHRPSPAVAPCARIRELALPMPAARQSLRIVEAAVDE
jgi:hypothetical protein